MTSKQGKGKEALEEDFEDQEKENTRTLNFMKLRESTEQQMHVANSRIDKCQEELKKQQEKDLQLMTESNVSENPLNFDGTDGILRQKGEQVETGVPCAEANDWYPVQMVANHHVLDQNLSHEIHSPVTQGIERRAVGKSRLHPVIMKKEEESAASQSCHSFELQEEVKKLKEQLRESKGEIRQLKAELGRYLFLEDKEKRSGKLQLLPRGPTSGESRQYAASSSCDETSLDGRLLVEETSLKTQPGEQVETGVLCAEANEWYPVQMVANHCASDQNLSHEIHSPVTQGIERRAVEKSRFHPVVMKKEEESAASQNCYSFELQEEVKKLKEQLRESEVEIRQLKAELGRYLFLEDKEKRSGKLQLLPRGPTSDESRQYAASSSCDETSLDERLLVEEASLETQPGPSLRTIYIDISNSLSAAEFQRMKDLAKGKVNDLKLARMRVPYQLLVELERVSDHPRTDIRELLESIQRLDRRKKLGVSLDAGIAAVSPGFSPLKDESLNLLSAEDEETRRSRTSARSSALSGGENGERISGNQEDNSYASFLSFESSAENEREIPASRDTEDNAALPLESVRTDAKEDTHISFSSDQAGPLSILSSTSSNSSDSFVLNIANQLREGSREPDAANSSNKKWELQGARPKRTQTQRPGDLPLRPSSSPVSDGLAKDFLARHSQDRAVQESLYRDDRDLFSFDPERLQNHSFVDGLTSASEAYSARSYFGTMGASLHERLGGAFSELPSGGSADRAGLLGSSLNNESSYSGSTHTTAAPLPSFTGQTPFSSVSNRMSSDGVHTINRLLPPNEFATSHHSLTGGQDFSREWDYLLNQNFRGSRLSLQQINTLILPNPRFVYGSTSSDFAAGIRPGYLLYGAQRHVLSNGSAALIDDQRSYNGNLNLESQSSQCGEKEPVQGSFDASGVVDSLGIRLPFMVPCTKVVSNSTSQSSVAVDGIEETSLLPVSSEVNSEDTWSNRDYGRNTVEPNDNSLPASEQRTTEDSSALLPEREEREEFMRELQRKEQMIREERERERREKEDREWQEAEKWPPQQEGVSTGSRWLCEHYQRRCTVRFPCCGQFYACHLCHNSSSNCQNGEAKACDTTHLKCSLCQFEQEIDENSDVCSGCGEKMAAYFCSICKHFTSFDKNPYHCDQCGICRIHKDKSFHCEVCNVCLDKRLENNHKCRPDSGYDECFICLEGAFSGCHILPCSHKVHRECAIAMIQNGIRTCPVCRHPLYTPLNE